MNTQEQKRVLVLNRILAGHLSTAEAAVLLTLSHRQVQRMLAAYRKEGVAAVVHGNRGRKPTHRIGDEVRQQVIALAREPYQGCNQQHLRDLLAEREGIVLSRASVHRILHEAHSLPEPQRRQPQHRRRRTRYGQEGMLMQIDGSRHAWLGERGPWLTLIAAIDDATGKIIAGVIRSQEDAHGYFLLVRQMLQRYGRPLALNHDRHSIFQQTRLATEADTVAEQLAGKQVPTQFGRLLEELDITSIAARSPQAKGRVERLFGILQDRIDELYTQWPFYGSRRITAQLQQEGVEVNRKAVQRHMREMGIEGISPGPNLSKRNQKEGVYPYLLRHISSAYPNHIWGIDITYIRLHAGWMYLVAILDWYSRYIVSWLRHEVACVAVETG